MGPAFEIVKAFVTGGAGFPQASVRYSFTGWKGDVPIVRFDCSKIKALAWRNGRFSAEALRDAMEAMRRKIESE